RARVERLQLLLELLELLPRRFRKPGPPRAVEGADRVEVRAVGLAVDLDPERHEGGGSLRDGGGEAADEGGALRALRAREVARELAHEEELVREELVARREPEQELAAPGLFVLGLVGAAEGDPRALLDPAVVHRLQEALDLVLLRPREAVLLVEEVGVGRAGQDLAQGDVVLLGERADVGTRDRVLQPARRGAPLLRAESRAIGTEPAQRRIGAERVLLVGLDERLHGRGVRRGGSGGAARRGRGEGSDEEAEGPGAQSEGNAHDRDAADRKYTSGGATAGSPLRRNGVL